MASDRKDYVPAAPQLWLYDFLAFTLTMAWRWRSALTRQIDPQPGDVIADVGCGTATQLRQLARVCPSLTLIGIDPDPPVLERAHRKVAGLRTPAELIHGYARDAERLLRGRRVNKIVSSLVFHQVPPSEKQAAFAAMYAALVPGGSLHIADYELQRTPKMRKRFEIVQKGDGHENTEPNARGVLPQIMTEVGFQDVAEPTYSRHRPARCPSPSRAGLEPSRELPTCLHVAHDSRQHGHAHSDAVGDLLLNH